MGRRPAERGREMSWAAHNPEKYDEIVLAGVLAFLRKRRTPARFTLTDEDELYALEELSQAPALRRVWDLLVDLSFREIVDCEADYWASRVDAALERMKELQYG